MLKPDQIYEVRDKLKPDDFYRQQHRVIYEAMLLLADEKQTVDLVTVSDKLRQMGMMEKVGVQTLLYVQSAEYTAVNVDKYVDIIKGYRTRRELVDIGEALSSSARDLTNDIDIESFQQKLSALQFGGNDDGVMDSSAAAMDFVEWVDAEYAKPYSGIMTGFESVDNITRGFHEGDLVILAARPSMGKTAFAVNVFGNVAKAGFKPLFFSLEMTRAQIMARIVADISNVDSQKILQPKSLAGNEWDRYMDATNKISHLKFSLTDKRGLSAGDISAAARRQAAKFGVDMVIVDHLQLVTSGRKREENRTAELDYITWALKNLAGELKVPVIALSQLSRGVEARNDKRPLLSDLRDSGAIEQNADMVITLYRDSYYNPQADRTTEISVKKNRNGGIGTVQLKFVPEYSRFEELSFGGQYVGEVVND